MTDDFLEIEILKEKLEIAEARLSEKERILVRYKERDVKFVKLLGLLNTANGRMNHPMVTTESSEETYDILVNRYIELMTKGGHMEIIEGAIKENESVANTWKQFMVMLRMTGFDEAE